MRKQGSCGSIILGFECYISLGRGRVAKIKVAKIGS